MNEKTALQRRIIRSVLKSLKALGQAFPMIMTVLIIISLIKVFLPADLFASFFTNNLFIDPLIGSFVGSILAGNPVTSYILGGELLSNGVSLFAVTSFIVAWVTVGVVSFPMEKEYLGKRFAIWRNISAFILSLVVAIVVVFILRGVGL